MVSEQQKMERPGEPRRHSIIFSVAIYLTGSGYREGGQLRKVQKKQSEKSQQLNKMGERLKAVSRLIDGG